MIFNLSLSEIAAIIPAILVALVFHEYAHGKVANMLGDPTPDIHGRLTLNPMAHLDPLGTLMILFSFFGWAKPVQVNPTFFRGDRSRGMMLVALAGPGMNLLLAIIAQFLMEMALSWQIYELVTILRYTVIINVYLAIFNMLPIPPLDGSKVLHALLPPNRREWYYQLESYGPLVLILFIMFGITSQILQPIARVIITLIDSIVNIIM